MEPIVSTGLSGWGFTEHHGQPTGTHSQTLNGNPVDPDRGTPSPWTHSPSDRLPEPAGRVRAPGLPAVNAPTGDRTRLLDLHPGDRVRLPVTVGEPPTLQWSEPVTITDLLLIDTELVQVRWSPAPGQDPFAAHLLLTGPVYHAGALQCLPTTIDQHE